MGPAPRVGGRLLLLDPDDRVLLVGQRPDGPDTEWLLPGGDVEPGESPTHAAIRAAHDQTGIAVSPDQLAELCTYRRRCTAATYDQVEHVHVARLAAQRSVVARPPVLAHWWTLEQLRASTERVEPPELADLVARALAAPRMAGRVLLLDDTDRVLLVENAVDVGASDTHWITPGGGAEPGETPAQAATREVFEELGLRIELAADAEPDYSDHEVFTFNGRWYDQTNHYYVVRLAPGSRLVAQGVDEIERSVLVGERWWSLAELRDTDAVIYPVGLLDVLRRLLYDEPAPSA